MADHEFRQHFLIAVPRLFGGDLAATAQHADAVGNLQHLVELVADEDHGVAAQDEVTQRFEQFAGLRRSKNRGRLVEDQDARLPGQDAEDFHPLLFARRKILNPRPGLDREVECGGELRGAGFQRLSADCCGGLRPAEMDVFRDGEGLHQLEMLMHHTDAGSDRLHRRGKVPRIAIDDDLAGIRLVDAGEDIHQCRFAGTVLAEQRVNFPSPDFDIDILIGDDAGEIFGDALEKHDRRRSGRSPRRGLSHHIHRASLVCPDRERIRSPSLLRSTNPSCRARFRSLSCLRPPLHCPWSP